MSVERAESKSVSLLGSATIYEVAALRDSLVDAMSHASDLQLDLTESGKWDLAGLQLLISCVNSGRQLGHEVRLVGIPTMFREAAKRSGLSAWLDEVEG